MGGGQELVQIRATQDSMGSTGFGIAQMQDVHAAMAGLEEASEYQSVRTPVIH